MTTQRTWASEEKLRIVMEGLSPKANVSEVCRHYGINSTTFYQWKEQALAGMKAGLKSKEGSVETALRQENAHLKRLVAEQALGPRTCPKGPSPVVPLRTREGRRPPGPHLRELVAGGT